MATHTISRTAAAAGVSTDTLRYYERLGLLAPPDRTANGYRVYDPSTAERVRLIKSAQRLGLRLDSIRDLLSMLDAGAWPCGHTRTLAEQRVTEINSEVQRLQSLRDSVLAVVEDLDVPTQRQRHLLTGRPEVRLLRGEGHGRSHGLLAADSCGPLCMHASFRAEVAARLPDELATKTLIGGRTPVRERRAVVANTCRNTAASRDVTPTPAIP